MKLFGYIEERIAGTEDIRSLGARPNAMKKFYGVEKDRYNAMIKAITVSRLISVVFTGLIGFGITLVFILGIPLFNAGSITLGTIFLMNYYVQQLVYPIFEILRQLQTLQQADASIERIEEILDLDSEIENNGIKKLEGPVTVTFKDVNFAYFEDQKVLQSISFELSPGEQLGLIGRTGSGKTTISRLLYRLYNIGGGEILLNGIHLQDYELSQLRRRIGLVSQDVQLFNTTLRNNITFFDSSIPDEKLNGIIESLNLKTWFNQLPKGFDTRISADDVSAGQAQLIALSRIFLEDPALIILDEASSRLDPATEKILSQALEKIMYNKTAIIIAHRLSTLNSVDKILELSYGEILEYGFREELIQNTQSSYAKLVRTGEEVLFA
jgi:ABC-type multidrug transport system fused ATPase/permease subunit